MKLKQAIRTAKRIHRRGEHPEYRVHTDEFGNRFVNGARLYGIAETALWLMGNDGDADYAHYGDYDTVHAWIMNDRMRADLPDAAGPDAAVIVMHEDIYGAVDIDQFSNRAQAEARIRELAGIREKQTAT